MVPSPAAANNPRPPRRAPGKRDTRRVKRSLPHRGQPSASCPIRLNRGGNMRRAGGFWTRPLLVQLNLSTCCRHHPHWCRSHSNLVVPMVPGQFHTANYFAPNKRLRQDIPSAQVQCFSSKAVVCKSGCDDQGWRIRYGLNVFHQIDPCPGPQVTLTNHHRNVMLL